jgi:hypothetical protein
MGAFRRQNDLSMTFPLQARRWILWLPRAKAVFFCSM